MPHARTNSKIKNCTRTLVSFLLISPSNRSSPLHARPSPVDPLCQSLGDPNLSGGGLTGAVVHGWASMMHAGARAGGRRKQHVGLAVGGSSTSGWRSKEATRRARCGGRRKLARRSCSGQRRRGCAGGGVAVDQRRWARQVDVGWPGGTGMRIVAVEKPGRPEQRRRASGAERSLANQRPAVLGRGRASRCRWPQVVLALGGAEIDAPNGGFRWVLFLAPALILIPHLSRPHLLCSLGAFSPLISRMHLSAPRQHELVCLASVTVVLFGTPFSSFLNWIEVVAIVGCIGDSSP
jgi:hypothetical protein